MSTLKSIFSRTRFYYPVPLILLPPTSLCAFTLGDLPILFHRPLKRGRRGGSPGKAFEDTSLAMDARSLLGDAVVGHHHQLVHVRGRSSWEQAAHQRSH